MVVARSISGGGVTTGIIVDETLVGVSWGDRINGSTMGDVWHGLEVCCETWVGTWSWVWSALKDSLRSFITFFDKSLIKCGKILRVFLWTHLT